MFRLKSFVPSKFALDQKICMENIFSGKCYWITEDMFIEHCVDNCYQLEGPVTGRIGYWDSVTFISGEYEGVQANIVANNYRFRYSVSIPNRSSEPITNHKFKINHHSYAPEILHDYCVFNQCFEFYDAVEEYVWINNIYDLYHDIVNGEQISPSRMLRIEFVNNASMDLDHDRLKKYLTTRDPRYEAEFWVRLVLDLDTYEYTQFGSPTTSSISYTLRIIVSPDQHLRSSNGKSYDCRCEDKDDPIDELQDWNHEFQIDRCSCLHQVQEEDFYMP